MTQRDDAPGCCLNCYRDRRVRSMCTSWCTSSRCRPTAPRYLPNFTDEYFLYSLGACAPTLATITRPLTIQATLYRRASPTPPSFTCPTTMVLATTQTLHCPPLAPPPTRIRRPWRLGACTLHVHGARCTVHGAQARAQARAQAQAQARHGGARARARAQAQAGGFTLTRVGALCPYPNIEPPLRG